MKFCGSGQFPLREAAKSPQTALQGHPCWNRYDARSSFAFRVVFPLCCMRDRPFTVRTPKNDFGAPLTGSLGQYDGSSCGARPTRGERKITGFQGSTCKGQTCQPKEQDKHIPRYPPGVSCQRTPDGQGCQCPGLLFGPLTLGALRPSIVPSPVDNHRVSFCLILALALLIRAASCPLTEFAFPSGIEMGSQSSRTLLVPLARGLPLCCPQARCNRVPYPNENPLRSLAGSKAEHAQRPWSAQNQAEDARHLHSRLWRAARAFWRVLCGFAASDCEPLLRIGYR